MDKAAHRQTIKKKLHRLKDRHQKSQVICSALASWLDAHNPSELGAFWPTQNEPNIGPLLKTIAQKKTVWLPRFNANKNQYGWAPFTGKLTKGPFGILEPNTTEYSPKAPDHCFVPALGVDGIGNRLGWGKGYIDRLLSCRPPYRVGVVFDCQRVQSITPDYWDVALTSVITEKVSLLIQ